MTKVDLDSLQVIEQSQHASGFGFNCFSGIGFWCGNLCAGFACW